MDITGLLPLMILFAYLCGSLPTAYLAGKWLKGIDIRHYGSGTVSGSMVYEHVHRWTVVPVGLIDIAKAALPTYLALRLGLGETGAAVVGIAAIVGHNWSVFLKFAGGRGISPFLGVLLVLFPWGDLWLLGFLAAGFLLGDSAPFTLVGIAGISPLDYWLAGPPAIHWVVGAMLIITAVKRVEANRRPWPDSWKERWKIFWLRLIFDRDMVEHKLWIRRRF